MSNAFLKAFCYGLGINEEEHRSLLKIVFGTKFFNTNTVNNTTTGATLIESSYFGWRIRNEVATAQLHETEASFSSWQQAFIGLETGETS
jgi:uncharacterized protein (UPF0332 family)